MGRFFQPETCSYLLQIQSMNVEDLLQTVCCVCVEVRFEGRHGFGVQEMILFDQSFELFLDVDQLVVGEFIVV